jgi:hypothetical protein
MMAINQELFEVVQKEYNKKIIQVMQSNSVYKIKTDDNKLYMLKKAKNRNVFEIYKYLLSEKFINFIPPEVTINNQFYFNYDNQLYYLMKWFDNIDYPIERKLIDYIDLLNKLHKSTEIRKKFNKTQFVNIYKRRLRGFTKQFELLDLYLMECEDKEYKSLFDWTYLMKYNEFMMMKNILLKIQTNLEDQFEKIEKYDYCIIHNNPNIDHFVVTNEKNYLISFDYSTIGLKVHDYIKLFIDYSEYEIDWLQLMKKDNIENFEFNYFIFDVLYYIVKNMQITFLSKNNSFESINTLIHNLFVASRAISLFNKYELEVSSSITE